MEEKDPLVAGTAPMGQGGSLTVPYLDDSPSLVSQPFPQKKGFIRRKTRSISRTGDATDSDESTASRLSVSSTGHGRRPSTGTIMHPPLQSSVQMALSRRKTLVLDLDETLIHSTSKGSRRMKGHMVEVLVGNTVVVYHVYKRPHTDYFLRKVGLPPCLSGKTHLTPGLSCEGLSMVQYHYLHSIHARVCRPRD